MSYEMNSAKNKIQDTIDRYCDLQSYANNQRDYAYYSSKVEALKEALLIIKNEATVSRVKEQEYFNYLKV
tara:strand:+ start:194 stop:403 length:210 start_codon:yes stop_codon:yes gene_type:complete